MVYLDFAKAFDSVPHKRLLVKLEGYGITGELLQWTRQFLTGIKQRVRVAGQFSEWAPVASGIPQGSVLGPVLFVCYINDLPDTISSFIYMYADSKIFRQVNLDADRKALQDDLEKLCAWAVEWQLHFNVGKCKVMHMGTENAKADMSKVDGT